MCGASEQRIHVVQTVIENRDRVSHLRALNGENSSRDLRRQRALAQPTSRAEPTARAHVPTPFRLLFRRRTIAAPGATERAALWTAKYKEGLLALELLADLRFAPLPSTERLRSGSRLTEQ